MAMAGVALAGVALEFEAIITVYSQQLGQRNEQEVHGHSVSLRFPFLSSPYLVGIKKRLLNETLNRSIKILHQHNGPFNQFVDHHSLEVPKSPVRSIRSAVAAVAVAATAAV